MQKQQRNSGESRGGIKGKQSGGAPRKTRSKKSRQLYTQTVPREKNISGRRHAARERIARGKGGERKEASRKEKGNHSERLTLVGFDIKSQRE